MYYIDFIMIFCSTDFLAITELQGVFNIVVGE